VVAQHRAVESPEGGLAHLLAHHTKRTVRDAEDKDPLERCRVYLAPPDYHLLVEPGSLALSTEDVVQFARPSIDVLFETAADAYGERAIGIILTGANDDGAAGLARIKQRGGVAIVQDPESSERRRMPEAAIAAVHADAVLRIDEMGKFLYGLCCQAAPA
jgi:two-component system, chemotaxis family, protein-glutamate methylesterase/glutaminase